MQVVKQQNASTLIKWTIFKPWDLKVSMRSLNLCSVYDLYLTLIRSVNISRQVRSSKLATQLHTERAPLRTPDLPSDT